MSQSQTNRFYDVAIVGAEAAGIGCGVVLKAIAGRYTVQQVANWMSTAVAKGYKIPNKGAIAPGYDADLVLVDLENYRPVLASELQTKCG